MNTIPDTGISSRTITYSSKYQPVSIIEDLIKSGKNTHLIKDKCGSGATHSLLTLNNQKIILVSPTVALVKDKEVQHQAGVFPDSNIHFLYGGSLTNTNTVVPELLKDGHIVMGTADQIVKLDIKLFAKAGYVLVIDELHVDIMSCLYRKVFENPFLKLIKTFKKYSHIITVTATPVNVDPDCMSDFNILKLEHTHSQQRDVNFTDKKVMYESFLHRSLEDKRNIVFFSNSATEIDKFCNLIKEHGRLNEVKTIFGENLRINNKVKHTNLNADNPTIYICSSAATEGIDILLVNASIVIHNKYETEYGVFSVQSIVQAIGRCRNGYGDCLIYNDDKYTGGKDKQYRTYDDKNEIVKCALLNKEIINATVNSHSTMSTELLEYKYFLRNTDKQYAHYEKMTRSDADLFQMIENICDDDDQSFEFDYATVINNVTVNNRFYGFSINVCFAYLCTKLMKLLNMDLQAVLDLKAENISFSKDIRKFRQMLVDRNLIKGRYANKTDNAKTVGNNEISLYNKVKFPTVCLHKQLQNEDNHKEHKEDGYDRIQRKQQEELQKDLQITLNDFEYLYSMRYPNLKVQEAIKSEIEHLYKEKRDYRASVVRQYVKEELKKTKKELKKLIKKAEKSSSNDNEDTVKKLQELENKEAYLDTIIKEIDLPANKNILLTCADLENDEYLDLDEMNEFIYKTTIKKYLRESGALYIRKYYSGVIKTGFREYSALTSTLIEALAIASPHGLIEADITEAFPSFVAAILGIEHIPVYEIIMKNLRCERREAKKLFNMYLNSTNEQIRSRVHFFAKTCEYGYENAIIIADINDRKGEAFHHFTKLEKAVIEDITPEFSHKYQNAVTARRHDSLIVFVTPNMLAEIDDHTQHITTEVVSTYKGKTINLKTQIHIKHLQ